MGIWAVLVFGGYLVAMLAIQALHLRQLLSAQHRWNIYLEAEGRLLLILDLVLLAVIMTVIGLRQIFSSLKLVFPCWISHLTSALLATSYLSTWLLRISFLVVVFSPKLRARYKWLLSRRMQIYLFTAATCIGVILWVVTMFHPHCHHICYDHGCFFGSDYTIAAFAFAGATLVYGASLKPLKRIPLEERLELGRAVLGICFTSIPCFTLYFLCILARDHGHLQGDDWEVLISSTGLLANFFAMLYGHILPSIKHGYTPFRCVAKTVSNCPDTYLAQWRTALQLAAIHNTDEGDGWLRLPTVLGLGKRRAPAVVACDMNDEISGNSSEEDDVARIREIVADKALARLLVDTCRTCLCEELGFYLIYCWHYRDAVETLRSRGDLHSIRTAEADVDVLLTKMENTIIRSFIMVGAPFELKPILPDAQAQQAIKDLKKEVLLAYRARMLHSQYPALMQERGWLRARDSSERNNSSSLSESGSQSGRSWVRQDTASSVDESAQDLARLILDLDDLIVRVLSKLALPRLRYNRRYNEIMDMLHGTRNLSSTPRPALSSPSQTSTVSVSPSLLPENLGVAALALDGTSSQWGSTVSSTSDDQFERRNALVF